MFAEEQFDNSMEELHGIERQKRKYVLKYAGDSIVNLTPYYQLYRCLDKGEGECTDYLYTQIGNDSEKGKILKDRYKLFEIYEKAFETNRDFFIDSAPRARWNKGGYFNIEDGHHRATYLFYKGIWDIPIRIQRTDQKYIETLVNLPDTFLCESFSLINKKSTLAWRKQNIFICRLLRRSVAFQKNVFVNLNDGGYISRYCCRMRCNQCIDVETKEKFDFAQRMSNIFCYQNLLTIDKRETLENAEWKIETDIAVMDEEHIFDARNVCAAKYIIRLEENGVLHNKIRKEKIEYTYQGKFFDGEKTNLIIQIYNKAGKYDTLFE